jgi:prepilin-type N-terminal cleavage/methylation domain-containing protein
MKRFNRVRRSPYQQAGFTLLEILVIVVIVGILATIAAPSWLQYVANRQVEAAQDEIYQGIQQAQTQAIAQRSTWQFTVREQDEQVAWAIHPQSIAVDDISTWQAFDPKITVDWDNTLESNQEQVYTLTFDFKGMVETQSIITVEDRADIAKKKCVLINNLLGRTSKGQELSAPNRFGLTCF